MVYVDVNHQESKRVNELDVFEIASALWSGSLDDHAWQEEGALHPHMLTSAEVLERDIYSR